jgi:hypothetical protein
MAGREELAQLLSVSLASVSGCRFFLKGLSSASELGPLAVGWFEDIYPAKAV